MRLDQESNPPLDLSSPFDSQKNAPQGFSWWDHGRCSTILRIIRGSAVQGNTRSDSPLNSFRRSGMSNISNVFISITCLGLPMGLRGLRTVVACRANFSVFR